MSDEQDPARGDARPASGDARPRGKRERSGDDPVRTMPRPKRKQASRAAGDAGGSRNPITRIVQFLREVVSEMKKVIWPTKNEWATYTVVVIVFIVVILGITIGLDIGFGKAVSAVFG